MRWAVAIGGLTGALTSHFWFHLNCVPGLVLTIIVLAALQSTTPEPSGLAVLAESVEGES